MRKFLKQLILFLTILVFSFPIQSLELNKDLKLLDLSNINEESCRYSGRSAISMNNKFSEFVQGYKEPLPVDGASAFIEDNVAFLNNAFAGYGSDKEDNIFKKRIMNLVNSNSFKKIDWEEKGGSSPSFVTTLIIKSLAYSTAYLKSKNKLSDSEISQISNYINVIDKNTFLTSTGRYTSREGGNVAIDQRFSRGTNLMLYGAAINDKDLFTKGYSRYLKELKTLDKRKVFSKNLRHNNETLHHVIQGAEVLRINGFNVYDIKFKKGTLRSQMEIHAKNLIKNNNKKVKTSGDKTAKATSIVRAKGYGAHVAWIPFYLNDPKNKTKNIERVHEIASGFSLDDYYGGQLAIHSGCLYGNNYTRY
tara:strand:- start:113 stop:1201 length:1089 start_codon:yes stop_codon:yes gene_type:complete